MFNLFKKRGKTLKPWQKKIEAIREQERLEKEREDKFRRLKNEKWVEEKRKANLEQLDNLFKCHVCGTPSKSPGERSTIPWGENEGSIEADWTRPGDLIHCIKCGEWTCKEDNWRGICKICAEKL